MIKQLEITVEPEVTPTIPDEYEIELGEGTLSRIRIRPALGPNWEVYTRLLHLENAFIPDDNSEWIPLGSVVLEFSPKFDDWKGIYVIKVQICSPQALFSHTIQYDFTLDEKRPFDDVFAEFIARGF